MLWLEKSTPPKGSAEANSRERRTTAVSQDLTTSNTFGLPSHAQNFVLLHSYDQLNGISLLSKTYTTTLILGGGSNVILPPILSALIVKVALKGLQFIQKPSGERYLVAQAGESWHDVVKASVEREWGGLENLALIPGTVGAAPVQNIGAYGKELSDFVVEVTTWSLKTCKLVVFSAEDCNFAYRDSIFKHQPHKDYIITSIQLRLPRFWQPHTDYADVNREPFLKTILPQLQTPQNVYDAICRIRSAKLPDPALVGNAGSFFKNPIISQNHFHQLANDFPDLVSYPATDGWRKLAAAWLIEHCGCKSMVVGGAAVHQTQALVLINKNQATFVEVMKLAASIRDRVIANYGVHLEFEPRVFE